MKLRITIRQYQTVEYGESSSGEMPTAYLNSFICRIDKAVETEIRRSNRIERKLYAKTNELLQTGPG